MPYFQSSLLFDTTSPVQSIMIKIPSLLARKLSENHHKLARLKSTTSTSPFRINKRSYEEKNRAILNAHNDRRLKLASPAGKNSPSQWTLPTPSPEPKIVKTEHRLLSLKESAFPYKTYGKEEIKDGENFGEYFDPLFNPLLHEKRHQINPDEKPFDAIYADSKSESSKDYTRVRNITTPDLWDYVERLARIKVAPEPDRRKPNEPLAPKPSGFIPPPESPPDLPYFIPRTRNYLLPVYYRLDSEPEKCCTIVRQVTGDLWKLEEDLRNYLESLNKSKRRILTSVHETDGVILFRGRHLHQVVAWLHEKGF